MSNNAILKWESPDDIDFSCICGFFFPCKWTWQVSRRRNSTMMRKTKRGWVALVFREAWMRHRAWQMEKKDEMQCTFFGGGDLEWYQLQQHREKPWQLMCWWGRRYWPRWTDSYWQNGENTCQCAPSEGVFKGFGGLSNAPVVLPAGRGSLAVTDREAVYKRVQTQPRDVKCFYCCLI